MNSWWDNVELLQKWDTRIAWALGIAGLITAALILLQLKWNDRISDLQDVTKREQDLKIVNLEKETAQLRTVGESAKEAAARAIVEAEKAKKEREIAETGRLAMQAKVLELEIKAGKRHLTAEKKASIKEALAGVPKGKVYIRCLAPSDRESAQFTEELGKFLAEIGYAIEALEPVNIMAPPAIGIWIVVESASKPPPFASPIKKAFGDAGFEMVGESVVRAGPRGSYKLVGGENAIIIDVGIKPPY